VERSGLCGMASSSCHSESACMRSNIYGDMADSTFGVQHGAVQHLQAADQREGHSIHHQSSRQEGEQPAGSASDSDVEVSQVGSCRKFRKCA
jgi:hypothetical protein